MMEGVRAVPRCPQGRVPVDVGMLPLRGADGERGAMVAATAKGGNLIQFQ